MDSAKLAFVIDEPGFLPERDQGPENFEIQTSEDGSFAPQSVTQAKTMSVQYGCSAKGPTLAKHEVQD
jgi:hypothetical protein